jgi:hypothetical protein
MIGKKGGQFLSSMGTPATTSSYNKATTKRLNSLFHDNLKENHLATLRKHTALESFLPPPDILDPRKFHQRIEYSVNIHVMN